MLSHWNLDPEDPLAKSLRRLKQTTVRFFIGMLVLLLLSVITGVPHLRTTYQYVNSSQRYIPAKHRVITSAVYYGPLGKREFHSGHFGSSLPVVKFIPLRDCLGF